MMEIFGEFDQRLPPSQEYLRIQFSPSSVPLKQRWRSNGLSAHFMADFLMTFFLAPPNVTDVMSKQDDIQGTISYIANELLENAMKFTDDSLPYPISLTLYLSSDRLVFISANSVSAQAGSQLKAFIHRLSHSDFSQLYLNQLEKSAQDESDSSAGLGILTMMNDYAATIGWKLEPVPDDSEVVTVTTMVQLTL